MHWKFWHVDPAGQEPQFNVPAQLLPVGVKLPQVYPRAAQVSRQQVVDPWGQVQTPEMQVWPLLQLPQLT